MEIALNWYLSLSAVLFTIGAMGVLTRRNAIIVFLSVEMMLNAVNLSLVAFSQFFGNVDGLVLVFFVMSVAAAEAAVGLAIVVSLFRARTGTEIDDLSTLRD
jgi:NADH-quinone oxidoreductase subunit K